MTNWKMASPPAPRSETQKANERTPLLRSASNASTEEETASEIVIDENDELEAAAAAGSTALRPDLNLDLRRSRSYSHSHWLAPNEDDGATAEVNDGDAFKEDGLLGGISRTRFRFIFGGIVLGYFVSYSISFYR